MSETTAFEWIEITAFRGFRDRQRIELSASAVVVVGPNGTGKTSFFDALQWLLLGSLHRLAAFRVRKNDEHIVNAYVGADPAIVEAELRLGGRSVRLRRQGRYDSGLLEWEADGETLHGDEAERALQSALRTRANQDVGKMLMTSGLLQQDVVRAVLEVKPSERYEHLAALLGLDDLGGFEDAVGKRADRLGAAGKGARHQLHTAEGRVEQLTGQLAKVQADVRLEEDVRTERERIIAKLRKADPPTEIREFPSTSASAAILQETAGAAANRLDQFRSAATSLADRRSKRRVVAVKDVDRQKAEAELLSQRLVAAKRIEDETTTALAEAEANASKLEALTAQALELLGPTCPVCGQDISPADVEKHLHGRLDAGPSGDLAALRTSAERAHAQYSSLQSQVAEKENELAGLLAAQEQADALAKADARWRAACSDFSMPPDSPIDVRNLALIHGGEMEALTAAADALRLIATGAAELVAVLRSDASDAVQADLRSQLRRAEEAVAALKDTVSQASLQEENAKVLRRATTRAVAAVTDRRFRRLAPTVQDIYWRLNPHPSFTTFDFDLDVYREKGIASPVVRDESYPEMAADPLLVFSSSQANVTALSYFLALGWAAGTDGLPFVLLDDPLQSMDDVNALGFADLCRHIRGQRQLIVSTHDRRLAALLQRKLSPRTETETTRLIEFQAWTREGPDIDQQVIESQFADGRKRSVVPLEAA